MRDPGTLDVLDIVQENSGERLRPQIFRHTGGIVDLEHGVLRLKRPANERREAGALILLRPNALQMLDSIFNRLDMAEHHRRARFQPELVRHLHYLEPFIAVDF